MKGFPEVVDGLNTVYRLLLATEQQAHAQEHRYEAMGYGFSDWFDDIEEKIHTHCIHSLMTRINDLGGRCDIAYAFEPTIYGELDGDSPTDVGILEAVQGMAGCLTRIRSAYGEACEVAEAVGDYVTEKMIWGHLEWVEKKLRKFERRLLRIRRVGLPMFLAEYQ